ncbi:TadE/TadG family type IV pilus assembly protein [Parvularcula sp. LCG005]|uniref:TadE/TadG family type IV pilus assembly protein n=1 Tax=Parvularcula sp. LCG005 TaxID=3078805 RepID=UPI0029437B10|nr:TadE/TadG family type IV pilus assembly protein [Parvularcula sp. LCG005]WOI54041.1 TadE/TadG family type IV pilus assembly protein [Parvularcula sp. LCG005]
MIKTRRSRGFWRRSDGASAVEFAIIAPVFIAAIFALFQGGVAIFSYAAMQNCLEAGARHLLFDNTDEAGTRTVIMDKADNSLLLADNLTIDMENGTTPVPYTRIKLTYTLSMFNAFGLEDGVTLNASTVVPLAGS